MIYHSKGLTSLTLIYKDIDIAKLQDMNLVSWYDVFFTLNKMSKYLYLIKNQYESFLANIVKDLGEDY